MFNDVYSDYAFLNECIKMRYIMNSRKTSLKLKHQKNKVNYKIEVVDYSAPIV
jgi:hypothetical protein